MKVYSYEETDAFLQQEFSIRFLYIHQYIYTQLFILMDSKRSLRNGYNIRVIVKVVCVTLGNIHCFGFYDIAFSELNSSTSRGVSKLGIWLPLVVVHFFLLIYFTYFTLILANLLFTVLVYKFLE